MPLHDITCCFTGHRPHKLFPDGDEGSAGCRRIKDALAGRIAASYQAGYRRFVSGMARGADMWAAEAVLALKEGGADVSLLCALPYRGQPEKWGADERERYYSILRRADKLHYVCERYAPGCMEMRNRLMVDMSSLVIAVYDGKRGGTKNTIDYAIKRGRRIVVIRPGE